jgi:hypothetical protein
MQPPERIRRQRIRPDRNPCGVRSQRYQPRRNENRPGGPSVRCATGRWLRADPWHPVGTDSQFARFRCATSAHCCCHGDGGGGQRRCGPGVTGVARIHRERTVDQQHRTRHAGGDRNRPQPPLPRRGLQDGPTLDHSMSLEHQGSVRSAKAERVLQGDIDLHLARRVRAVIEVALRILVEDVDGRR